jgi:hypothetical protein
MCINLQQLQIAAQAQAALKAMDGAEMAGRTLHVNHAMPVVHKHSKTDTRQVREPRHVAPISAFNCCVTAVRISVA